MKRVVIVLKVLLNSVEKIEDFVSIVSHSNCDVDLISGKSVYLDAKSILGILSCNINNPLNLEILGDDEDKNKLIKNIQKYIVE